MTAPKASVQWVTSCVEGVRTSTTEFDLNRIGTQEGNDARPCFVIDLSHSIALSDLARNAKGGERGERSLRGEEG